MRVSGVKMSISHFCYIKLYRKNRSLSTTWDKKLEKTLKEKSLDRKNICSYNKQQEQMFSVKE